MMHSHMIFSYTPGGAGWKAEDWPGLYGDSDDPEYDWVENARQWSDDSPSELFKLEVVTNEEVIETRYFFAGRELVASIIEFIKRMK